jgi:L-malate glycosyltransferase
MRRRIRVLHFISESHPTEYFRLIARYTDHSRFAMQVGSLGRTGGLHRGLEEISIPTFALGAERRAQYPGAVMQLARSLRRDRIDVFHAHLFEASIVGLLAARIAGVKLRVFTGHHSHEVPLYNWRLLLEVDRFAARHLADVVVAPSRQMRSTFLSSYGCDGRDVVVIEHGLDLHRFDPDRADGDAVRRELALEGKLIFGAISKPHWVKNLEALVRAFGPIATNRRDVHLVVLGVGDMPSLQATVKDLGLSDRVTLLDRRDDVPEVLAAFDVYVHAALAESFGFSIVEAMAMARPVITTPVGIAPDVVEDGVSGFVVTGTDPEALRDAMLRGLASRDHWPALATEARRRALQFPAERWVRAYEELYLRWLGGSIISSSTSVGPLPRKPRREAYGKQ